MDTEKCMHHHKSHHILKSLVFVMVIIALGAYSNLTYKKASESMYGPAMITVAGTGEVMAVPDIGNFTFAVRAEGEDAVSAQDKSAESMNSILGYLKEQGVADEDIKTTDYNLSPNYRYEERVCMANSYCPPGERVIDGYQVSQSVSVKVRETDRAGEFIGGVGERGATNISSLFFTTDDDEALKAEARKLAIEDAKAKAEKLAEDLGVKIIRISNFSEGGDYYYPMMYEAKEMSMDESGFGGAMNIPSTPMGENSTTVNVNLTFEIK